MRGGRLLPSRAAASEHVTIDVGEIFRVRTRCRRPCRPARSDRSALEADLSAGALRAGMVVREHDHAPFSGIDHVFDSRVVAIPRLQPVHPPRLESIEPEVFTATDVFSDEHANEVAGEERLARLSDRGVDGGVTKQNNSVAVFEGTQKRSHNFDVLLRHRPPSIPARADAVTCDSSAMTSAPSPRRAASR